MRIRDRAWPHYNQGMTKGRAPYIPDDQFLRVYAAQIGNHALRDRTILLMSHYTGLRAMEIAALKVENVFDFETGQVARTMRLFITKGSRFREAWLAQPDLREHLRRYLLTRPMRPDAPVFLSQKGGAFSRNTMQKLMHRIYARASVQGTSHSGRRTFAINMKEKGCDLFDIMLLLGHRSIRTTQNYLDVNPLKLERLVGQLGNQALAISSR